MAHPPRAVATEKDKHVKLVGGPSRATNTPKAPDATPNACRHVQKGLRSKEYMGWVSRLLVFDSLLDGRGKASGGARALDDARADIRVFR